ncbi:MAG: ABC transporter permease [Candidatus Muiribacteriota bacterium]
MLKIYSIALNTLREAIRDKIFYSLIFFAFALLFFSWILSSLTISDPVKIIKDFGLGAVSLIGVLIAVFIGIGLFQRELDKKTIYVLLAKPVQRWEFLLGKYFGLCFTIFLEVVFMTFLVILMCYSKGEWISFYFFYVVIAIYFELLLILGVAFFFSSFSSSNLSAMFTLSVFVIGHFTKDLKLITNETNNVFFSSFIDFLYYLLPNLEFLNYTTEVVHNLPISVNMYFLSLFYAITYTFILFMLSVFIFNRKEIR